MKKFLICFLSILLMFGGCAYSARGVENEHIDAVYVKSVWMSYYELEKYTSGCDTAKEFEKKIRSAFQNAKSTGMNTITVQVRPCADAFYKSDYYPVSEYCFGVQGSELKYDPLMIMVEQARKLGLRIEAWVNPYRVSQNSDISKLSDGNMAKIWYMDNKKKSNVYINDKIYYNPASNDVKELIINGVKEIVQNYNVDAIHFDDYFYPTTNKKIDEKEYEEYTKKGGKLLLSQWRRDNVSDLIKKVYSAIKEINPSVEFGVSPQAKISADKNTLYADVERWVTQEGFLDYICPQVYFGFYNEAQPFISTVKSWCDLVTSCKLYFGLALYKAGQEDRYASPDQPYAINEFKNSSDVISRQISYLYQLEKPHGFYIFSYSYLTDKDNDYVVREVKNIKSVI